MAAAPSAEQPSIREILDADGHIVAVEAGPLSSIAVAPLNERTDANEAFARLLSVNVDAESASATAIAGSYRLHDKALRFTPRFAFRAGQAYRAVLRPEELGAAAASNHELIYRFQAPADAPVPPTEVTAIFPSAATLPENQLRFYIHFSAPMARGSAYEQVRLLDNQNRPIDLAFLELGQELWDSRQLRLTLLIDPGRIKRGVKPREDLGPVFRAGDQFTLVVPSSWQDAQGRSLGKGAEKRFRVGPPIEEAIDPARWRITAPAGDSHQRLAIDFPRPLDHALLQRMLRVRAIGDAEIQGEALVSQDERRWEFLPAQAWRSGEFEIVVDSDLEDLAGNRIGRAFEVDQLAPEAGQAGADAVRLKFEIRSTP
jgi:hypothetical protein